MNSAIETFGKVYPLGITVQNQYQGEDLPIIYIVDQNSSLKLEELTINVTRNESNPVSFEGFHFTTPEGSVPASGIIPSLAPGNASLTPGNDNYNLAVAFRPGVLKQGLVPKFSGILQTAVASAISGVCSVYGPVTRSSDGALIWYCAFQNTFNMIKDLNIELSGISAEPGVGSRSTQLEVYFGNVSLNGSTKFINFSRSAHIDILNHQGHTFAPLYFGVLGVNELVNKPNDPQLLNCYFETTNRKPIQFGPNTRFLFGFSYDDDDSSALMHFGSKSEVNGIKWKLTNGIAVQPHNRLNTFNKNSKSNFDGEFLAVGEGPYVPKDLESPGTQAGSHPTDAEGYTYFSQTFHHKPSCNQPNPEHTSVQKLIVQYQKQQGDNLNYYKGASGPAALGQQYMTGPTLVSDFFKTIDWSKEVTDQDFFSEVEVKSVANKYLPLVFSNGGKWLGSQNLLSLYNGADQASFNSTRTLNYKTPFNGATWLAKTNGFVSSSLDIGISGHSHTASAYFYLSFYFGNYKHQSLANYPNSQNYFYNPWGYVWTPSDPGSFTSSYCAVNPAIWNDPNFVSFLSLNFEALVENLASLGSSYGDFFQGTENLIVPSQALYNYLIAMYTAYRNNLVLKLLSKTLINITKPITVDNWKTAYNSILNYATVKGSPNEIVNDDFGNPGELNSAHPWTDTEFLKYVNDNMTTLAAAVGINLYQPQNTNGSPLCTNQDYGGSALRFQLIVPSAALYNYFFDRYQLSIYQTLLPKIPEKTKVYINPVSCIFNFEEVQLSGDHDGTVLLHVRAENIPGYWDTDFQIPIIKKIPSA